MVPSLRPYTFGSAARRLSADGKSPAARATSIALLILSLNSGEGATAQRWPSSLARAAAWMRVTSLRRLVRFRISTPSSLSVTDRSTVAERRREKFVTSQRQLTRVTENSGRDAVRE